jgi:hypothetical protein
LLEVLITQPVRPSTDTLPRQYGPTYKGVSQITNMRSFVVLTPVIVLTRFQFLCNLQMGSFVRYEENEVLQMGSIS